MEKRKNLEVVILVGMPGCGKSTWAKDYCRKNENYIRVNRDDFRDMLKGMAVCEPKIEFMITDLMNNTIMQALHRKLNVIVDNTNLKAKYINAIIKLVEFHADIKYRIFTESFDKCLERNNQRERKVSEPVMKQLYNDYKNIMDTFVFQDRTKRPAHEMTRVVPNMKSNLPHAVVFDIDGTLALMNKRGPYDWHKVFHDDINEIVAEQAAFHKSKGRTIIIVTGRDAICREDTSDWLDMYNVPFDLLLMRPQDDMRKDSIIKKEIYDNNIRDQYNVLCVYDDRLQVLEAWHDLNVFTFNVNQGNVLF